MCVCVCVCVCACVRVCVRMFRLWSEEARTLFPMQCYLYTNELAMECLPYLKMMYMTENNNRQTETKRRR